jgi:hypothetical protein
MKSEKGAKLLAMYVGMYLSGDAQVKHAERFRTLSE